MIYLSSLRPASLGLQKVSHCDFGQALGCRAIRRLDGGAYSQGNALADGAALGARRRAAEVGAAANGAENKVKGDRGRPISPALASMAVTRRTTTGLVGIEAARQALDTARSGPSAPLWAR